MGENNPLGSDTVPPKQTLAEHPLLAQCGRSQALRQRAREERLDFLDLSGEAFEQCALP
jgi:hypothetical protein